MNKYSTVDSNEKASAFMDARLWEFIDMAAMWPEARPDSRIWDHVMVYAPKKEWDGLTEDEILSILENLQTIYNRPPTEDSRIIFARAIEAKLRERNHE